MVTMLGQLPFLLVETNSEGDFTGESPNSIDCSQTGCTKWLGVVSAPGLWLSDGQADIRHQV